MTLKVKIRARNVAGRKRRLEEATRTASGPAEPHGPRRCGGPEHSAGRYQASGTRNIGPRRTQAIGKRL